jgi:ElaA protein
MSIEWQWSSYEDLSKDDLYEVLLRRQEVFVIEQNCAYMDCDGIDPHCFHLLGWKVIDGKRQVVAYMRCVPAGIKFPEVSLGRVLNTTAVRGTGAGREMMTLALEHMQRVFPNKPIRISAQQYLEAFYQSFDFVTQSEPYDEDDIPHVEMLRSAPGTN